MSNLQTNLAAFEAHTIANAVRWTAFLRAGPHVRIKLDDLPTRAAAVEAAGDLAREYSRNALVYAVTAEGRSTMVGHVTPAGVFV